MNIIAEKVTLDGSASNAIPDILLRLYTTDRNLEKIHSKLRPPHCHLKEFLKNAM